MTDEATDPDIQDDERKWIVDLQNISFSTTMVRPDTVNGAEVEAEARERLIEAIRSGEANIRWSKLTRDAEDVQTHQAMADSMRCERCDGVDMSGLAEIDVDSEFYEVDFDADPERGVDGNEYVLVCSTCKQEMWDAAHASDDTAADAD